MLVARAKLQRNFGRAAADYDTRAEFQHIQTRRVLDAALMLLPARALIADIGCGTGYFAAAALEKRPDWKLVGVDIAPGMCAVAANRCVALCGDAARLPLADARVDAVVSSLCYQWTDMPRAFAELARVLKPGGRAIIASLGEHTLHELRDAACAVELPIRLLPMQSMAQTTTNLRAAGLTVMLADMHLETRHYASVAALMDSMRAIGAGNNFSGTAPRGIAPKRWAAMVAAYEKWRVAKGIPATWEHQFFVVSKAA